MVSVLISADDIKKELLGYTPGRSEEFHEKSAHLADKRFDECLKSTKIDRIILMSGGPASGKTEFVSEYLTDKDVVIFDGVLPTVGGAEIKINHIKKAGKKVSVYAIWPEDFKQAYLAFLNRDRKFSDEYFYSKHASSRKTLLWIAQNYPEIEIRLFKNAYLSGDLRFAEVKFDAKEDLVDFLAENQYNKEDIIKLVTE